MRVLKTAFTIVAVAACLYAIISPLGSALLFGFVGDYSAFVGLAVTAGCIVLLADIFRSRNLWVFLSALTVLSAASLAGIFFHFRDSGESGPLPYEWLNDYWLRSLPLLFMSAGFRAFRHYAPFRA